MAGLGMEGLWVRAGRGGWTRGSAALERGWFTEARGFGDASCCRRWAGEMVERRGRDSGAARGEGTVKMEESNERAVFP